MSPEEALYTFAAWHERCSRWGRPDLEVRNLEDIIRNATAGVTHGRGLRCESEDCGRLFLAERRHARFCTHAVQRVAIQRFGSRARQTAAPSASARQARRSARDHDEDARAFAPAQFFEMSDAEKLSRPSFADYDAGVVMAATSRRAPTSCAQREVAYEELYVPERQPVRIFSKLAAGIFNAIVGGSAVARSPLSHAARASSALAAERVRMGTDRFAVVSTDDMSLHGSHLVFDSATAADQALRSLARQQPEFAEASIEVVPLAMMQAAAEARAA